jgi:AcrR family transcriptional regulator
VVVRLPAARRRRQLLDVAVEVFAGNGFHGTSMDEVAEAAGVTKPVLYQHFGSKHALYLELLDDVGNQLLDEITKAVATAVGPRQQVEAGFVAYYDFVARRENAFRLLFGSGARRDEEFAEAVSRIETNIADAVAVLIEADLDDEHRRFLAHGIVGLAESTSRRWVAQRAAARQSGAEPRADSEPVADPVVLARRIAELVWAGLRGVHRDEPHRDEPRRH